MGLQINLSAVVNISSQNHRDTHIVDIAVNRPVVTVTGTICVLLYPATGGTLFPTLVQFAPSLTDNAKSAG
jgi:hypothetical protein